jgi:hypothetical protein
MGLGDNRLLHRQAAMVLTLGSVTPALQGT